MGANGIETVILPVAFDCHNEPLLDNAEFNNTTLEETEEVALASDLWNSELEAIFLPKKGVPSERKIKK